MTAEADIAAVRESCATLQEVIVALIVAVDALEQPAPEQRSLIINVTQPAEL